LKVAASGGYRENQRMAGTWRRSMDEITLRSPQNDDWPAILKLAELSLAELPDAPSQVEWLNNRKSFLSSDGIQQHFVATLAERIVGYACIEHGEKAAPGEYRLWVVVAPCARKTIGTTLLARLWECLLSVDAHRARMVEYEVDTRFISYLEKMGFVRLNTFNLDDGTRAVELSMDAPFQSLSERS
jgi:N-acetylglutamate synthase-like GNAT family acetyltransferase